MQSLNELTCSDCNLSYKSAAPLLQHFAQHAKERFQKSTGKMKGNVPDLYPIACFKKDVFDCRVIKVEEKDENGDSGFEDVVNPMTLCEVMLNDDLMPMNDEKGRKYECKFCNKIFGWSTDLKRHELRHTGERPFVCEVCNVTFTRKFLLQRHHVKKHTDPVSSGVPELKPISCLKQSRKMRSTK